MPFIRFCVDRLSELMSWLLTFTGSGYNARGRQGPRAQGKAIGIEIVVASYREQAAKRMAQEVLAHDLG